MDKSEYYNELLDRYFRNEMDETQQKDFLSEVDQDKDLKKLFDQHNDIIKGIELSSLKGLKSQLQEKEASLSKSNNNIFLYLRIAAGICLLAIAAFLLFKNQSQQVNTDQLFAANYEPYPNIVNPLNRSSDADMTNPYNLFELKEYSKALEILDGMEQNDTTIFYLGQVHLAMNNTNEAIVKFKKITSSPFNNAALWYTALSYISNDELDKAITILQSISYNQNPYSARAQQLLGQLE